MNSLDAMNPFDAAEERRRRRALAALAFAAAAPLAYMTLRLLARALAGESDALSMIHQGRAAYPWRVAIAAYWGGVAAIAVHVTAPDRSPRIRPAGLAAAALLGVVFLVLAWVFP